MTIDYPARDQVVIYTTSGGELTLDVDWEVSQTVDLVVERTRAGRRALLVLDDDYRVENIGEARGARVRLSVAAQQADVYAIAGTEPDFAGALTGLSYGLGTFIGDWAFGRTYLRGQGVYNSGSSYVAIKGHVASSDNRPGVGALWRQSWRLVAAKGGADLADNIVGLDKLTATVVGILADATGPTPAFQRGWLSWISAPAITGSLALELARGVVGRFDRKNTLRVNASASLRSTTESQLFSNTANVAAVQNASGGYEVLQFKTATLVSGTTYDLTGLLRGQGGTESQMGDPTGPGARVVFR